ncbi:hypothetical protein P4055_10760 [Pseudomonas aeruginosa]|nr:hypothetical protein [Pseudomonas aeruginosa]
MRHNGNYSQARQQDGASTSHYDSVSSYAQRDPDRPARTTDLGQYYTLEICPTPPFHRRANYQ